MYGFYMFKYVICSLLMMSIITVVLLLVMVMKFHLSGYIVRHNTTIVNVKILEKSYIPCYNFNTFAMVNLSIYPITISTAQEYRIYFYENEEKYFINSMEIYSNNKKDDIITLEKNASYFFGRPYNVNFKII